MSRMKSTKALLGSGHVAVIGRGQTEDPVDSWLRGEGLSRRVVLRVPSYSQAIQAVAQTDLAAVVPKRLAESLAGAFSLALLDPPVEPGEYQEYLFYPERALRDPASVWLREFVLEIGHHLGQVKGRGIASSRRGKV